MTPPGYKQTEVGVIPEEWDAVQLASITPLNRKNGIVDGPFGSNLKTIHYRKSGIPIITSGYVTDGVFYAEKYLYVDPSKFREEKRSAVQPGDIVMAKIGERCGASAILPPTHETGILSGNALKITVDETRHSTAYVWQVLWDLHTSGKLMELRTVGAQPALSMASLKRFKIPVPPTKAEQRAIATVLSDVDALLAALDRLIAKQRDLKQAAMQQLLTGQTRLPGFTGKWEETTFGNVVRHHAGNSALIKGKLPSSEATGLFPAYSASGQDVWCDHFEHEGDAIVVSAVGSRCGKAFSASGKWCAIANTHVVWPNCARIDTRFLAYFINDENFWQKSGTGQPFVLFTKTFARPLCLPGLPEQTAIATVLSDMDLELAALEQRRDKTRALKQGMMQELLTGRTRLCPGNAEPQLGASMKSQ